MTVTKETIIKKITEETGWSRSDSKKAMQKLLGIMFKALSNGEDILISGFGKFKVLHKGARLGRNPHTMEEIKLKARKVVSFKASETLRRKTNLSDPHESALKPDGGLGVADGAEE
ncbi:MAG: integration host factor subunit alpha [Deltaproteobacteria bacterium]|jgi:integration host factor subunit alpha|nr:integration host factor subunit alpha [Deltaproteobacteria bacterium]